MDETKEIISWISENGYSKTGELIYFYSAVLGLPLITYLIGKYRFVSSIDSENTADREGVSSWSVSTLLQWILVPIFIYALLFKPGLNGAIDFYHEGEQLAPLQMIQNGAKPYQDIYVQHGLIRNVYFPVVASKLFGTSIQSVRELGHYLEPLSYLVLYFIGLLVYRGKFAVAILPVLICSGADYWIGIRQGIGISIAFWILLWVRRATKDKDGTSYLIAAGLLSAFCFWFSIEYGLYSIFATVVFLFATQTSARCLIRYLLGLSIGMFPVFALLLSWGVFADFIQNTYQQVAYQLIVWGLPFPQLSFEGGLSQFLLSKPFRVYFSILVLICSACFLAFSATRKKVLGNTFGLSLLLLTIFSLVYFRTALGRSDYGHWIDGSTLLWVIVLIPFDRLIFNREKKLPLRILAFGSLLVFLIGVNSVHDPINGHLGSVSKRISKRDSVPMAVDLARIGGIAIPKMQKRTIHEVLRFIDEHSDSGDYIYDFSNQGAYYFLADRRSPTRYFQVAYAVTNAMQQEVVLELKRKQAKVVVFSTGTFFDAIDGVPSKKRHKIIYDYLQEHYRFAAKFEETTVLLPK